MTIEIDLQAKDKAEKILASESSGASNESNVILDSRAKEQALLDLAAVYTSEKYHFTK